jgi:hypothetical protein
LSTIWERDREDAAAREWVAGARRAPTRVCLEIGSTWVFATAFDWPGWGRRARSEEEALECLLGYNDRYRIVVGKEFDPGPIEMVGRSDGNRNGLRCKIRHDQPDDGAPTSQRSYHRVSVPCCSARHAILPIVRMHRLISTAEMAISVQRIM